MTHKELFKNPPREFTTLPFWFWNDLLDKDEIIKQIHDFNDKGVHGFIIHPRKGMPRSIKYMSETFLDFVEVAVEEAFKLDMQVILYDEAMYPSGSAHGQVVRNNENHASKGLKRVCFASDEAMSNYKTQAGEVIVSKQVLDGRHTAFVQSYSQGTIRGIHDNEDDGQSDAPKSADLLNKAATLSFIESTHEKYYKRLKAHFGKTIIGMFTDEPNILGRKHLKGLIPWTDDMMARLSDNGFEEDQLNNLFDSKNEIYDKTVYDMMADRFYKPLYDWCEEKGIALTGHPEGSDDIGLLKYFHIPGQDVVWRWIAPELTGVEGVHSTMAKCSSDSARHRGRSRNANEVLGCCGPDGVQWALTMDDFKWYMDYLFIRGVNMIYLHAFYYSVRSEVQFGERPPDVGPHNLWWPEFKTMADYIKRMSWLLTDSVNQTSVAVITKHHNLPHDSVKALYENQVEFNYLEEELIQASKIVDNKIHIEKQVYDQILIHEASDQTLDLLKDVKRLSLDQTNEYPSIRYSQILKDDKVYHLFCNEGDENICVEKALDLKEAEIWDPWTGDIRGAQIKDKKVIIPIERRSLLIVTEGQSEVESFETIETLDISYDWQLLLNNEVYKLTRLVDWSDLLESYSGEGVYQQSFNHTGGRLMLDLGDVNDIASVYINKIKVGTLYFAPYTLDITDQLVEGLNDIKICLKNSIVHHYESCSKASGLLGPVVLRKMSE